MNMPFPNYFPGYAPPPQLYEQEQIRFVSQRLGCTLLIMQGVSAILQSVVVALGFGLQAAGLSWAADYLSDSAGVWLLNVILTVPMFTIPFILGAKMLRRPVGDLIPLRRVPLRLTAALCGVVLGIAMVGNLMTNLFTSLTESFGIDSGMPDFSYPEGALGKMLTVLAISAVPALIEEFAFRGVFMGALRPFGDWYAIFISSIFFGLMHGNLVQIPFAFIVGLALGLTVKLSGSLWPAILAHFLNNFFSVLLDFASESLSESHANLLFSAYTLVALIAALAGGLWLLRHGKLSLQEERYDQKLHTKEKVSAFFRAPVMIVASILMVGGVILNILSLELLKALGIQ